MSCMTIVVFPTAVSPSIMILNVFDRSSLEFGLLNLLDLTVILVSIIEDACCILFSLFVQNEFDKKIRH